MELWTLLGTSKKPFSKEVMFTGMMCGNYLNENGRVAGAEKHMDGVTLGKLLSPSVLWLSHL